MAAALRPKASRASRMFCFNCTLRFFSAATDSRSVFVSRSVLLIFIRIPVRGSDQSVDNGTSPCRPAIPIADLRDGSEAFVAWAEQQGLPLVWE